MTSRCGCHSDISDAFKGHQKILYRAIEPFKGISRPMDWPDVRSDAYEALWKALVSFDESKGKLGAFLYSKIRQSVIDGLRQRHGRHEVVRRGKFLVQHTFPLEECHDLSTDFEWEPEDIRFTRGEIEEILRVAGELDTRMPEALWLRMTGMTFREIGEKLGTSLRCSGQREDAYWSARFKTLKDALPVPSGYENAKKQVIYSFSST